MSPPAVALPAERQGPLRQGRPVRAHRSIQLSKGCIGRQGPCAGARGDVWALPRKAALAQDDGQLSWRSPNCSFPELWAPVARLLGGSTRINAPRHAALRACLPSSARLPRSAHQACAAKACLPSSMAKHRAALPCPRSYGRVKQVRIVRNPTNGESRGESKAASTALGGNSTALRCVVHHSHCTRVALLPT